MKEIFPPKREARETKRQIDRIEGEINQLDKIASISDRLIKAELKDVDDEIEDHLVPQLDRIMQSQNLPNITIAEDLVVIGYVIDTDLEEGIAVSESVNEAIQELTEIVLHLLKDEFPNADKVSAELVVTRSMINHKEGFYVDTLLNEIEIRRAKIREVADLKLKEDNGTGGTVSQVLKENK